jgi:lipoprotein
MEMTMKTVKLFFKTTCLFTAAILTGCTADVAQEEEKNKEPNPAATNITFTSENPSTRTSITHSIGKGATPFWSTGDRIWVKSVSNQWQQSSAGTFSSDMSNGVFSFSSGTFEDNCEVHYTGANGTEGNKVTIANEQMQSAPNNFSHAGASGDCGVGRAKGNGKNFKFKLSHKASYLCFLPHSSNELIKKSKLIKIEVISKDNIAGTFDFSNGVLSYTRTRTNNSDKVITLTTGNGFSIEGSTDIEKNGSYIVIAPGNHELTVRYWLRYKTYSEDIKGTITKTFKLNCEAGKIYDIKAKLDPTDYSYKKYYMWDCAIGQDYWKGNEKYQPKTKNAVDYSHYPKSVTDPRWYNERTAFPAKAYRSCDGCPNVNETWWFIQNGDPHWDSEELWVMYDHLYTGGMWFKKKDYISGFNSSHAPNGTDYTTKPESASYNKTAINGRPDEIEKCFYLPALGGYDNGRFYSIGEVGNYWTCTPTPWNNSLGVVTKGAYYLYFYIDNKDPKKVTASIYGGENRYKGFTWWEKK